MELLQQARAEIDTVDAEMAALFERRMRAVATSWSTPTTDAKFL